MSRFAETGRLIRLGLRLDRIRLALWVLGVGSLTYFTASAFRELYPTVASRAGFAATLANTPALLALTGPPFDLSTIGGLTAWRIGGFGPVMMGMLGIFTMVRHTRTEEESGRVELIGAAAVGRLAPLTAAFVVAFGATFTVGAMVAAGLASLGEDSAGAVALGLSFAAAGWLFSGVAALVAQLTQSSRTASGLAGTLIGLSFGLRAIGDSTPDLEWMSWLSPIGWSQRVRPFAGERWEVLGLPLAVCAVAVAGAYSMAARRDLGASLVQLRPRPSTGNPALGTPLGLAWRLQRETLASWAVGLAVLGLAFGAIADSIGGLLDDNPQLRQIIERLGGNLNLTDAFFASLMGLAGLMAGAYAVQSMLLLRTEETNLRAELTLATRITRTGWVLSHLAVTAAGTLLLLTVISVTAGLVHGGKTGDIGGPLLKLLGAGLVQVPAVLVLAGLTVLLLGLAPRWVTAAWGAVAASLVIEQLGQILRLKGWVSGLSPYSHLPQMPGSELRILPLVVLSGVAAFLVAAGLTGFRRRDIG
ncbi:exporter of polyketide antibiotics [soil metagenome]